MKRYIITKNKALKRQNFKNIKQFNKKYVAVSKAGNTIIYQRKTQVRYVKQKPIVRVIKKKEIIQIKKQEEIKQQAPRGRFRISVVIYVKQNSYNSIDAYNEIRVSTINPDYTLRGLTEIAREESRKYGNLFRNALIGTEGPAKLGDNEDLALNDHKVHIISFIHGVKTEKVI